MRNALAWMPACAGMTERRGERAYRVMGGSRLWLTPSPQSGEGKVRAERLE